jgi:class 3 adenylate cyclase/alpha-beta hydrolase superfamily lysophospholipase
MSEDVDVPETQYAKTSDGVHIAYQIVGDGPFDLVAIPGYVSHVELNWADPDMADCLRRLAAFSRLIVFDRRGLGMSDSVQGAPTLEDRMQDLQAVMDSAASERAALFGLSEGGPMSLLFAATYPERVAALVLYGTFARMTRTPDYPWGYPTELMERTVQAKVDNWGHETRTVDDFAPSMAHDQVFRRRFAEFERRSSTPGGYEALMRMNMATDVRAILASVRVPTLILHRSGDIPVRVGHGRYLHEHIAGARYVEIPGDDHFFWVGNTGSILDEVEEFLTGRRTPHSQDRVLATVLFTDIVDSTALAARVGDASWRHTLERHNHAVSDEIDRWHGTLVKSTGDGVLATFDGPARAIRCAMAVRDRMHADHVDIRAGLHTGEIEFRSGDVLGIAVHIASRVEALAEPNEVLVSRTVTDLVAGSGIRFADRGTHNLKGVPGTWQLFAAA